MPPTSKEKLHRFEQRMHDKGSDGFADGPRPWEHWDESGNQANSRVWEGSARRIRGSRKAYSLGHRLLSLLAFLALATLLVGIGGVYYTHTQTQQVAQEGIRIQPLPITDRTRRVSPAAEPVASKKIVRDVDELNVLTAPAAGSESASTTPLAADDEMAGADSDVATAPPADETAVPVMVSAEIATAEADETTTGESAPPLADSNIDSVSIETVVTEKSVTTTVYTRHPQQDEPEVIAAIETTPPPFVHEVTPASAADAASATGDEVITTSDEANGESLAVDTTGMEADSTPEAETVETQDMLTLTAAETETPPAVTATIDPSSMAEDTAIVVPTSMEADAGEATTVTPAAEPQDTAVLAPSETETDVDESAEAADTAVTAQDTAVLAPSETQADVDESVVAADTVTAQDTAAIMAPTQTDADADETATAALTAPEPALEETTAETPVAEETTQTALAEPASTVESATPAETAQASTAVKQPIMPVARQGDWVINLASYTWKSTANKKLALFKDKGVDAEVFRVMINDKPMYRVRVTGFESSRAAKAEVAAIEQTLDLEGAWVARR